MSLAILWCTLIAGCSEVRRNGDTGDTSADIATQDGGDEEVVGADALPTQDSSSIDAHGFNGSWIAPGFVSWKTTSATAPLYPGALGHHDNSVQLVASGSADIAIQAACTDTCVTRLACFNVSNNQVNAISYDSGADGVHAARWIEGDVFAAVGSFRDSTSTALRTELHRYWRAEIDASSCTLVMTEKKVPAASWLRSVGFGPDGEELLLVGRTEAGTPESLETPWLVGTNDGQAKELRVAPEQGPTGLYRMHEQVRMIRGISSLVIVGNIQWIDTSLTNDLERLGVLATFVTPKLDVAWMGQLPGTEGNGDVDGAALMGDGSLVVSWHPRAIAEDPKVHTWSSGAARYVARFGKDGTLLWKKAYNHYIPGVWQPIVVGHDDSLAVLRIPSMETKKRSWMRLLGDGSTGGSGPQVAIYEHANGVRLGNTLALAWLDGDTLHVEHHAWPPNW